MFFIFVLLRVLTLLSLRFSLSSPSAPPLPGLSPPGPRRVVLLPLSSRSLVPHPQSPVLLFLAACSLAGGEACAEASELP